MSGGASVLLNRITAPVREHAAAFQRYGLALAGLGGLVVFSSMFGDPYGLPKLLAVSFGAWLAWLGLCLSAGRWVWPRTPMDAPLGALGLAGLVSVLFSLDKPLSFLGQYASYAFGYLPWLVVAAVFYAAAAHGPADQPRRILTPAAGLGGALGLYGLLQRFGVEPLSAAAIVLPPGQVCGTGGTLSELGAYLVMLSPAAVRLSLSGDSKDSLLGRSAVVLMALCLLASGSIGALLACAAGAAVTLCLLGEFRPPAALSKASSLPTLALAVLLLPVLAAKLTPGGPDLARLKTWEAAVQALRHHPLTGTGPDTLLLAFRRHRTEETIRALGDRTGSYSANNDIVQLGATMGLLGLAAYAFFLWGLFRLLSRAARADGKEGFAAVLCGSAAGLFLYAKYFLLPLPVLAGSAAGLGLIAGVPPHRGPANDGKRARAWAVLGLLSLILLLIGRLCLADLQQGRAVRAAARNDAAAAAAAIENAVRLVPSEMRYQVALNQLLLDTARGVPEPTQRRDLLISAAKSGETAVRWHPQDPAAHHMLGASLLLLSQDGGPDRLAEADAALDRAQELDPYFLPLWHARLVLAAKRDDKAKFDRLFSDFQRVKTLMPKDQQIPPMPDADGAFAGDLLGAETPSPGLGPLPTPD